MAGHDVSIASTARGVFQARRVQVRRGKESYSFNRFNSAGGIPGANQFKEMNLEEQVSIASTARGVFQEVH